MQTDPTIDAIRHRLIARANARAFYARLAMTALQSFLIITILAYGALILTLG